FGYNLVRHKDTSFMIASVEKTLLDYLYLNSHIKMLDDIESLRFNKSILRETLNKKVFKEYLKKFNNKKLTKRINILLDNIKNA
ncbi:MAG: hypothetical protein SNJ71_04335, partial [Bacteroidales bacterium]